MRKGSRAAARVHGVLAGIENDLLVAHLEPVGLRPTPEWIAKHERAAEEIADRAANHIAGTGAHAEGSAPHGLLTRG